MEVKDSINVEEYQSIRKEIGWNDLPDDLIKRAIDHSMFNVSVYEDGVIQGVGRIVGDGALKGMLTDIMVPPRAQGKGVGKLIVTTLIKELEDMVKEGDSFQLEASPTSGNREFYIKCGLKYKPQNQDGVYIWIRK